VGGAHTTHSHAIDSAAGESRLRIAFVLIVVLMCAEIAVGVVAHSLALLSDSAHMLTDAGAIALSMLALRLARAPARGALTFGLRRVEILSAQANGVTLLVIAAFVVYEAVQRLVSPPHVRAGLVLAVAVGGALVNLTAVAVVSGADRRSLAVEGSFQHILTDMYGFLGTAVAAIVILTTGFLRADPLVSLLIAAIMIRSGWGLVLASGRVFLEAAPHGIDPNEVGTALAGMPGVVEIHDLHVWEVASGFAALSAHVLVEQDADCHAARRELEALLRDRFALRHTTLQVDHAASRLLDIVPHA
jgi:cobalt-zinc-cadmium efflux system protein